MFVLIPAVVLLRVDAGPNASWLAFLAIGSGGVGCIAGGLLAPRFGSARVAGGMLATSALCCLAAPWALSSPWPLFLAWLMVWGFAAAGDSPQFSALTARNAPVHAVGSVLTFVNCIGFAISIISIQLFVSATRHAELGAILPWLAAGPILGLVAMAPLWRLSTH